MLICRGFLPKAEMQQDQLKKDNISEMEFFTEYGDASRYKIQEVIGKGSYGVVCSAMDIQSREKVAIKKIHDIFEHLSDAARILREIKLLRLLRHPDIVEIKHIMLPPSKRDFKDIYVVFELMESDLHQVIKANDDLTKEHYQFFLYQLLRALKYIHTANVYHRDLKPKNILANANCKLKICDFGLARVAFSDTPSTVFWTDYVATRWYRAPELCGSFFSKALADPYFNGLAKVEREPSCLPIIKLEFEFERRRVTKEDIRELIFREILEYHPQLLKDYINGTERTNFLYPSAVDQFRRQFAHLEESGGRNAPTAPMQRKHVSLPRSTVLHSAPTPQKEQFNPPHAPQRIIPPANPGKFSSQVMPCEYGIVRDPSDLRRPVRNAMMLPPHPERRCVGKRESDRREEEEITVGEFESSERINGTYSDSQTTKTSPLRRIAAAASAQRRIGAAHFGFPGVY